MSFGDVQKSHWVAGSGQAPDLQKVLCVAAICVIASLPLLFSVALTIWGA